MLNICVPASVIEASGGNFAQSWQQQRRDRTPQEAQWLTDSIGQAPLRVTADVSTTLRTRELLNLAPGQVLSLGVPLDAGVNIRVGDIVKFTGRLAMQAGRAAVQVQQVCIAPLGGSHP
jgi:flagellar motor switch protein FliM